MVLYLFSFTNTEYYLMNHIIAMEDASSWTGSSWRLIGAITRLSERKMLSTDVPPIVVCIPCCSEQLIPGQSRRHSEYGDTTNPFSIAHGEFVANKLHPYIMNRFRVDDAPEHTSAIGSSLGGQASIQLLARYPEIFGGAACLSPCFQPGTLAAVMAKLVADGDASVDIFPTANESKTTTIQDEGQSGTDHTSLRSKRIYIDNGGDAEDVRVPLFEAMDHFTLNERWWVSGNLRLRKQRLLSYFFLLICLLLPLPFLSKNPGYATFCTYRLFSCTLHFSLICLRVPIFLCVTSIQILVA